MPVGDLSSWYLVLLFLIQITQYNTLHIFRLNSISNAMLYAEGKHPDCLHISRRPLKIVTGGVTWKEAPAYILLDVTSLWIWWAHHCVFAFPTWYRDGWQRCQVRLGSTKKCGGALPVPRTTSYSIAMSSTIISDALTEALLEPNADLHIIINDAQWGVVGGGRVLYLRRIWIQVRITHDCRR